MRVASETMADPLGQELRLTLQEQRMGLTVQQAIESLGKRADTPNMRIFARSLTQGERLGVSRERIRQVESQGLAKMRRAAGVHPEAPTSLGRARSAGAGKGAV